MWPLRLLGLGGLIFTLSAASCAPTTPLTWKDGYALAFLQQNTSTIRLRFQTTGAWQSTSGIQAQGSGAFLGVGLARRLSDPRTIIGYTNGGRMRIFVGFSLAFGSTPDDELTGVASEPAIVHVSGDEWLIAYTRPGGNGIEVRPYTVAGVGGFANPLNLTSGTTQNDNVTGGPAIAYFNGRLVLVWGRVAGNRAFRFVAADYQAGNPAISVVRAGDIPGRPGGYITEFQSSPALTHDGSGTFYLAVIRRSGLTGLTHDAVHVYSSPDGQNWTGISSSYPGNSTFPTSLTEVSIAAQPNGDVMLAIVSAQNSGGRVLRFRNGAWTELGGNVFQALTEHTIPFALVHSQYLSSEGAGP